MDKQNSKAAADVRWDLQVHAFDAFEDYAPVLRRYAHERLLYRLSVSPYGPRLVSLDGRLRVLPAAAGEPGAAGLRADRAALVQMVREVCTTAPSPPDGLVFDPASVRALGRQDKERGGHTRIGIRGRLGAKHVDVRVDFGPGLDVQTLAGPATLPALLDFPAPRFRACGAVPHLAQMLRVRGHAGRWRKRGTLPVPRPSWCQRLVAAWEHASVVWLTGLPGAGKTHLATDLRMPDTQWLDGQDAATRANLDDLEGYWRRCPWHTIIVDNVHYLADPARTLAVAAQERPDLRVLALSAVAPPPAPQDWRLRHLHLSPLLLAELPAFGLTVAERLLLGGLPGLCRPLMTGRALFSERLIQRFVGAVAQTTTTVEAGILDPVCWYCLQHSGTPLAASQAARELGLGEDVFGAHLAALVRARFVTLVPPLPGAAGDHAPLLYAGDTGLVTLARTGWPPPDYLGRLWCQVILEHLLAQDPGRGLWYWRDAGGGSVDFVVARDDGGCDAIVCAWDASNADEAGLSTLRAQHPGGDSCLVTPHAGAHGTSRGPELGHVIPLGGQGVW